MPVLPLLTALIACAPAYRMPGPLTTLGEEPAPRPIAAAAAAPVEPAVVPVRADGGGTAVAAAARSFLGVRSLRVGGKTYRYDCSGFVEASLAAAGCAFTGSSASLWEQARDLRVLHRRRSPSVGDVAFFDDTYDRNGNGRRDDPLSHVAIVERVDKDGTVSMVHLGNQGVTRLVMNLRDPEVQTAEDGRARNDVLRRKAASDGPRTRYLAGELWVGFASFWRAEPVLADEDTQ
jgi:cell wall-associated NlpC family hydrolase